MQLLIFKSWLFKNFNRTSILFFSIVTDRFFSLPREIRSFTLPRPCVFSSGPLILVYTVLKFIWDGDMFPRTNFSTLFAVAANFFFYSPQKTYTFVSSPVLVSPRGQRESVLLSSTYRPWCCAEKNNKLDGEVGLGEVYTHFPRLPLKVTSGVEENVTVNFLNVDRRCFSVVVVVLYRGSSLLLYLRVAKQRQRGLFVSSCGFG